MTNPIERIAIVGLAVRFPGAGADPDRFWAAVAGGVDCSSDAPPAGRWPLPAGHYLDPRVANPDTVYSTRGYYLDPFAPDLGGLTIDPAFVGELDPLFHLVLDVGNRAWRAARTGPVDRSRVGVVLGNICLPTGKANALCREYLGGKLADALGVPREARATHPLNRYVAGLPAGVLAKALGLGGGSFTLDAACASSLYALKLAADELIAGRADAMLAGGVNGSDSHYTQMGFAQLRALSASGRCSPFDAKADGLMVGEGAAVFVLKRLADAVRHEDKILAVIAGAGLSNDMHGNLLAPAKEGQLRAMRRAYDRAGWHPHDVDLIECHATGTPVGDAVEFESLRELWGGSGWAPGRCVIGSVKSTVGHLLTGAGAAAVAKVVQAMAAGTLPPQANFEVAAPGLPYADGPFRVPGGPDPWERRAPQAPRRAAVSGFGFGGVNAHLLLEEWTDPVATNTPPAPRPDGKGPPRLVTVGAKTPVIAGAPAAPPAAAPPAPVVPVAVVGMAAHFGPWTDLRAFQERVFGNDSTAPVPKRNGWDLADEQCPPGFYIEELALPIDRFRIPPKELEETLPQQLLMLRVAAAALDDQRGRNADGQAAATGGDPNTGVYIGLGLDPNTTNYHLRWSVLAQAQGIGVRGEGIGAQESEGMRTSKSPTHTLPPTPYPLSPDLASPALNANRVMGALGSIAASRIARAFHFGGPSHPVCSEEASAARALELAVRALRAGEIDRAVVGGVDLVGDPRTLLPGRTAGVVPGEGAAALVLKRLADAERDGDRVYAVVAGVGAAGGGEPQATAPPPRAVSAAAEAAGADAKANPDTAVRFDAATDVGHAGAASAAASLVKACLAIYQEILPPSPSSLEGEGGSHVERIPLTPGPSPSRGEGRISPRYWLRDREAGPRRGLVTAAGSDGSCLAVVLEEYAKNAAAEVPAADRLQPVGARDEAVFVVDGTSPADLVNGLAKLAEFAAARRGRTVEAVAREWYRASPPDGKRAHAVALVARSAAELAGQAAFATQGLRSNPTRTLPADPRPAGRDRVFFAPKPLGPKAKVAFVFPGSGNQFDGMGRDLGVQWPEVLRRQDAENHLLRSQFAPDLFWDGRVADATPRDLMFGQVTLGALVADVVAALGVKCEAMIGLSLGESSGLFGVRAWRDRDKMYRRMRKSSLFNSDLAPPYTAARMHWGGPADRPVDWAAGVIAAPTDDVLAALRPGLKAYLLIVNTPAECVIGGQREDVAKLAKTLGKPFFPLAGVTLAHCEVGRPVAVPYHDLHTLPATPPRGVTVYSGAWGRSYAVTEKAAADSITAGLLGPIDVPAVVTAAYRDGVRAFVEVGPGASCTRMIDAVLGDRPHLARAAHPAKADAVSQILRLVAALAAERVPVDLGALYGRETLCVGHREPGPRPGLTVVVPVGSRPVSPPDATPKPIVPEPTPAPAVVAPEPVSAAVPEYPTNGDDGASYEPPAVAPAARLDRFPGLAPAIEAACDVQIATMQAQETFLRVNQQLMESAAGVIRFQTALLEAWSQGGEGSWRAGGMSPPSPDRMSPPSPDRVSPPSPGHITGGWVGSLGGLTPPARPENTTPRALTFEQCCAFAAGKIADALGPLFAEVDTFPTRVRLPDGPLQLVDRITLIEGEPRSMRPGRVVTEHAVRPDRWYLEAGRIPTAVSVEAGQADLFLSAFLGIDFQTRGLAVYRLLDAVVSFHRGLPRVGETAVYDIRIDEFVRQGDAWLFRFRFDGTVNGEPFITMRNGVAGFFTAEALAAGRGIVQTALDREQLAGKRPADWRDLVAQQECSLAAGQVEALRRGDLGAAFGPGFAPALRTPVPLPGGMLRLVDRVPLVDPTGGRFGIGLVRAEFDIHPADWFLTCHFVDDMVMPGTLMYECCLHTLRIFLMRMGWVGEAGEVAYEPVPGVNSRLKCRGQVTAATKTVTYEVTVKELGFRPEPYCLADALMSADGKPIVEITNMALRMTGLSRERLEEIWAGREEPNPPTPFPGKEGGAGIGSSSPPFLGEWPGEGLPAGPKPVLYDRASILAFSNGNPSEAFGEPYRVFDAERAIARLPGPPFQFMDRVTAVTGEPFVLRAGAACEVEYDVPPDAWYFAENRAEKMPFSVLLEIALQPCGWLAAYCGSALTSPEDLSFRNLGGKATQVLPVTPDTGTLTVAAKMTSVSKSAGMIIQHYDMRVTSRAGTVYEGTTYFGFFSKSQLATQVGIRDAKVPWPSGADVARADRGELPHDPPFPAPMMRMVDRVETYLPDGGAKGLGLAVGRIAVDPAAWFFKAHFYQDPVWPGSLGLESFLQLLKYVAWKRWGEPPAGGWQTVALNRPHAWSYRGQVVPRDKEVTVVLEVTGVDAAARRLTANGFLTVDGRVIYQMTDFTLE
ncbi:MAG: 3-hydroxyacyl-[acyl-carrier-protein] dehydratase FabA [Gemmataceae bacterium]|nr:3-hydroxyacyl-[acyl-carrier-protein] dehydratase FabA [Gemmataceae bacterium]